MDGEHWSMTTSLWRSIWGEYRGLYAINHCTFYFWEFCSMWALCFAVFWREILWMGIVFACHVLSTFMQWVPLFLRITVPFPSPINGTPLTSLYITPLVSFTPISNPQFTPLTFNLLPSDSVTQSPPFSLSNLVLPLLSYWTSTKHGTGPAL